MTEAVAGPAPAPGLPPGWSIELDPALRRLDSDRVLIGGYPTRLLRLSPAGSEAVGRWSRGGPVGPSPTAGALARRLVEAGAAHPVPVPGAGQATRWSLVVPTRGDASLLAVLLATALQPGFAGPGTVPSPEQVVVVDDGSAEPSQVGGVAERFGAAVVRHHRRRGPAAARNAGWRVTQTEAVAFLDDDCRCPDGPGWVSPLLDHLADPAVALAAPRVRARRGSAPAWLAAYEGKSGPLDLGPRPAPIRRGGPVPYVPAAALLVRRAALEQVGGFDESLAVGEDVDLAWRLAEAGWSLRYEPRSVVSHDVRPDLAAWALQRFRYGTSAVALDDRRPGSVAPLRCSPSAALAWAWAATTTPVGLALGAAVAAGSAAALSRQLGPLASPAPTAARLVGRSHRWTGRSLTRAARREWWPLLALGLLTRRGRRLGLAVAGATALGKAGRSPAGISRMGFLALSVADDVAYGTGVWSEAIRRRRFRALLPALGNGPDRAVTEGKVEPRAAGQTTSST